jgi:hypothetical protein
MFFLVFDKKNSLIINQTYSNFLVEKGIEVENPLI